jgi:hypothetical protein
MTTVQAQALRRVATIILDAVKESDRGYGVPGGHIYAALMGAGCTLDQYTQLMAGLTRAGYLTRDGECYSATGKSF